MSYQPQTRPQNPIDDSPMLKMKELIEATGVSKATLLHYISLGLLPEPVRTNPNVAYYPASLVERVDLIRQLQKRHRLSLAEIQSILKEKDAGREVTPLIEVSEVVFGPQNTEAISLKALCKASGLAPDQVQAALEAELLIPKAGKVFDSEDLAIAKLLKQSLEMGVKLEELSYYPEHAKEIVKEEMRIRNRLTQDKPFDQDVAVTLELTRIARSFRSYVIDRIFQQQAAQQPICLNHEKDHPNNVSH